jgi:hypothetical protein
MLLARFSHAFLILTSLAATLAAAQPAPERSDPRAVALLEKVDDLWRGEASHTVMTMRVKTAHYQRTLKLEAWSKGRLKTLVRILSPAKDKGTATLKNGDAIYTYLPRTDRTIKLNAGMMGGAWMGSHFTNDDLVKGSRLSEEYVSSLSFEGVRKGRRVAELTLVPRPDAAVVWGRIVTLIDPDSGFPLESTYFDEDLKPVRRLSFGEVKDFGGRRAPALMRLEPSDPPGEWTELEYQELQLDPAVGEDTFTLARLKRRGP